ncbi:MAG TPA: GDP-mannose 4,6-dehydratase [Candidatus Limnocylindrales bacterium]|nr:GDP-mannose 4,6-dehydratase [Candidatus Limnocylindrales bacterium]
MRILITGIGGFVGSHLAAHLTLAMPDAEIHGTIMPNLPVQLRGAIAALHPVDLRDDREVRELITAVRPDHVYHLAAWAIVHLSFDRAWETLENNIRIQLNVIQGCLALEKRPRILAVTSGEVYGADQPESHPTTEDASFRPSNPYAVSKVAQDMLCLQYYLSHGLEIVRARPFNHLGAGQSTGFVAPDLASQIARIELGVQEPVIRCGDLTSERDFTDVRDIVRAYRLLIERGKAGEAYNVSSGKTHTIRELLDTLLADAKAPISVESDPNRVRSSGVRKSWGDPSKLRAATGWEPEFSFERTIHAVLEDCRLRVQSLNRMNES